MTPTNISSQTPQYINDWCEQLQPVPLALSLPDPQRAAIFSADMEVGFCWQGNPASERINALTEPIKDLFQRAYSLGVRNFVLLQDTHHESTPEFQVFPPHCLRGTRRPRPSRNCRSCPSPVSLPSSRRTPCIRPSPPALIGDLTNIPTWIPAIVVGNCVDLCVYHLAMHLRMRANARDLADFRVIVPANAVDTFDLPEGAAEQLGAFPHEGDFFHHVFLYQMALNGIRVVQRLALGGEAMAWEGLQDRFRGALLGAAIGDALGAPFEGAPTVDPDDLNGLLERPGPLRYTDDTHMTLGMSESLVECGGFNGPHLAETFARNLESEPWCCPRVQTDHEFILMHRDSRFIGSYGEWGHVPPVLDE